MCKMSFARKRGILLCTIPASPIDSFQISTQLYQTVPSHVRDLVLSSSPNSFVFKWRMPAVWQGSGIAWLGGSTRLSKIDTRVIMNPLFIGSESGNRISKRLEIWLRIHYQNHNNSKGIMNPLFIGSESGRRISKSLKI